MRTNLASSRVARMVLSAAAGLAVVSLLGGCERLTTRNPEIWVWFWDMKDQPKYMPQRESAFFADGREQRRPPAGTVAAGHLKEDAGFFTGSVNGMYVGKNPLPIDEATLDRGQQRFNVYCSPCHGRTGDGKGIVPLREPSWQPANLQEDRIKKMADGELFQVATYGRRTMHGYRYQVSERDRWAIVAYVRALQRASSGTVEDVPAGQRASLK